MSMPNENSASVAPPFVGFKAAVSFGLLMAAFVAFFSLFLPNYYRSEARILPADAKGGGALGQLSAAAAAFGVGVPGQDAGDANFSDILNSRSLRADLLCTEYKFHEKSWRFGKNIEYQITLYDYLREPNIDRALLRIGSMLSASRDLKSRIITISAESRSQELAYQMVGKACKELEDFVQKKGRTHGGEKARFTEARLLESKVAMNLAEENLGHFLNGNRNFQTSMDPSVRLLGNRLEAELKLKQQLVLTLSMNNEQALLEAKNDVPIVNVLDPANLPIEKSRPSRGVFVVMAFIVSTLGYLVYINRSLLQAWIQSLKQEEQPS